MAGGIHVGVEGGLAQALGGEAYDEGRGVGEVGLEPRRGRGLVEQDGHAIVDAAEHGVGRGRDHGAAFDDGVIDGIRPSIPKTGERQGLVVVALE